MVSSELKKIKILKIKLKNSIGRLEKNITDSLPKNLGISRTRVKNLISKGSFFSTILNHPIDLNYKYIENDILILKLNLENEEPLEKEKMELDIVFEDKHLIVINKKPGVIVHPGSGINNGTLVNGLSYHCDRLSDLGGKLRPGIVHRLDKDTSGLLVAAKTDNAYLGLREQFSSHAVKRKYVALVWGLPKINYKKTNNNVDFCQEANQIFKLSGNIGRHPIDRTKMAIRNKNNGKIAITRFKINDKFLYESKVVATLIECWLETGRTHQIRVHMSSINHGIVGDQIYNAGKKTNIKLYNDLGDNFLFFKRQALHAKTLSFVHPISFKSINFEAPPPTDFDDLLKSFYKLQSF